MFKYIIAGMTNEAALAKILKEEPKASTTLSSLQWTRSQLRRNTPYAKKYNVKGVKIRLNSELKKSKTSKPAAKPVVKKTSKPVAKPAVKLIAKPETSKPAAKPEASKSATA